ncbi:hypothetical protein CAPTEDRAFT_167222 [Capitella teleta]|uniref:Molybdate-anion transporter n=1 Tax=Capitella teleta TaxID=283909 RepID=R7TYD3_CAPTE|nr:hypothetical protein CAPTEDRAFT_167222 [Capitella teleta]|eukprot:ELT95975.1 hypothetical protein CAPTEDRAFT_167222 [Capitella teleta]
MMVITYAAFCALGLLCIGLQYWAIKTRREPPVGNNPLFLKFQRSYFLAYFPALLADWLQGPYLYKLYSHYGFEEQQIAVLYVCGFASTVILGTWAPLAADRFGRKKLCMFFTVVYSLACFFKLSLGYGLLLLGRLLGGVATSLLFSAFEAWYVHEHIETHDFPREWIGVTFNKASVSNGVLAIIGGFIANIVAEWMDFGPVAPFMLAVPCLLISGILVSSQWNENYSAQKAPFKKTCMDGLQTIFTDPKIFLIGIITALFESVMYIFVFIWTPVLDPGHPSLGIIFSSYMVCIMIGSAIFQLMVTRKVPVRNLLTFAIVTAFIANVMCIFATHHSSPNRNLAFVSFLIIEISVGIYFPSMSYLRAKLVPEATRRSVMNWFRVPMNLIACVVLMLLHHDSFRHGNRLIFVTCSGLLAFALAGIVMFLAIVSRENTQTVDKLIVSEAEIEDIEEN